jgi:hypothetical protein
MTFTRDQQISPLQANTSFYDWYLKENNEIIDKLNGMRVFGATSGEGISAIINNDGLLTISFGGTSGVISSGITFNGDISFNGVTSLNGFTPISNLTYKISGITSGTSGFTFGTPVYYNSSTGYTAGKANSQSTAETIGILSKLTTDSAYLTVFGKIEGDFTNVTGDGSALSPGCIYFLDSATGGKITTTEPTANGAVSKPVLLSVGATAGVVLQYRGNYLDSTAASGGASGSNIIYVVIATTTPLTNQFAVGSIISCNENLDANDTDTLAYFAASSRSLFTSNSGNKWFLSRSNNVGASINALSREEDFVVGMIISATVVGGNTIFGVAVSGSVPYVAPTGKNGLYALSSSWNFGSTTQNQLENNNDGSYNGKLIGIQYDDSNFIIINNPRKSSGFAASLSDTSTIVGVENVLSNGDFSIWQRAGVGRDSGYTGQENLIFADMWRRRDGITGPAGSKSYSIKRETFLDNVTGVEGDPQFYIDVKAIGLSGGTGSTGSYGYTGGKLEISHIVPDARRFAEQSATLSFYAKCGTADYIIQAYYARYNASTTLLDKTIINDSISLTDSWSRFDIPFDISAVPWSSGTNLSGDYFEIGFDFNTLIQQANLDSTSLSNTHLDVSIASVCLFVGNVVGAFHTHRNSNTRLDECRKLYYSSYNSDQSIASATMVNPEEPTYNCLGHMLFPTKYSNVVNWPVQMRIDPTCVLYSPLSGVSNEGYNRSSNRDLRNSSGTLGYNGVPRVGIKNTSQIVTSSSKDGINVTISGGAVPYDSVFYHIVADADYLI